MNQIFDINALKENLEFDDQEIFMSLYSDFVDEIYSFKDYVGEVKFPMSPEEKNFLRRELHRMKSSSKAVGAMQLGTSLDSLEKNSEKIDDILIKENLAEITALLEKTKKMVLDRMANLVGNIG